jgi:hypothetical protein
VSCASDDTDNDGYSKPYGTDEPQQDKTIDGDD